jgi:hypothetical protein
MIFSLHYSFGVPMKPNLAVFFAAGLIILALVGYLVFRSAFFPRIIGVPLAIGGLSYVTSNFANFLSPAFAAHLFPYILVFPGLDRRFRFAARHFITCTRRFSAAPFHELVKGLEICARFTVSKELRRLQSRKLFSHCCGDELVYARPIFLALSLYRSL